MAVERVVVIKKPTQLEELLRRHTTLSQTKFYLESRGKDFGEYREAHDAYKEGLRQAVVAIPSNLRTQVLDKELLPTHLFSEKDLVVVVGDAGLFVNAAKYVGSQQVIAVNPDPARLDDIFTTCTPGKLAGTLQGAIEGKAMIEQLTMAEARLEDGQVLYALNDIFIGRKTHVSARYTIEHAGRNEAQSSSGIIVSTGTGSTAWFRSVMTGAYGLAGSAQPQYAFGRSEDYLVFAVREPFPSKTTGTSVIKGKVTGRQPLKIASNMPEEGVIFSDGVEADFLEFTAGKTAVIKPADKKVNLVKSS